MKNLTILEIMQSEVKKEITQQRKRREIKEQSLLEFKCFTTRFQHKFEVQESLEEESNRNSK